PYRLREALVPAGEVGGGKEAGHAAEVRRRAPVEKDRRLRGQAVVSRALGEKTVHHEVVGENACPPLRRADALGQGLEGGGALGDGGEEIQLDGGRERGGTLVGAESRE